MTLINNTYNDLMQYIDNNNMQTDTHDGHENASFRKKKDRQKNRVTGLPTRWYMYRGRILNSELYIDINII